MAIFNENLKKYRQQANISLDELSRLTGIPKTTLYRYENGTNKKDPIDSVPLIEKALHLPSGTLLGWNDAEGPNLRPLNENLSAGTLIPVLGKVPAGIPIEAIEDIIDEVELGNKMAADGKEYFALLVSGNSMYPEYMDGDIVIVRKQETADTGDDVVAYVNGYDATLKRLVRSARGITLRPLNPEFEARTYTNEEIQAIPIRIAGVVVEQRRNRK